MSIKLVADCGSTKCEWCLLHDNKKKKIITHGISPYFLSAQEIEMLLHKELLPKIKNVQVHEIFYYGTGLSNISNAKLLKKVLKKVFPKAALDVTTDIVGAARALCGNEKGIVSILGTGSNSCYYNGEKIVRNNPGLGYVLGDEGSGAYLGKKVIQHFLYNTFDEDLLNAFNKKYATNANEILQHVYKQPQPNRYLASFAVFLAENRRHYIVENIIEDGLNDFFFTHICKYRESWIYPLNFAGSVAYGFRDVIEELCNAYEFQLGKIMQSPMDGLIKFHQ